MRTIRRSRPRIQSLAAMALVLAIWAGGREGSPARALDPQAPLGATPWRESDMTNWKAPEEETLRKRLTDLQYQVTQKAGTETPFRNAYWDHKEPGIYVDIVSGEPLFSSLDKYDSGTGWPSFVRPIEDGRLSQQTDHKLGYPRTEVRSKTADSHLGHVFPDGPQPAGLRYCINSAALEFIPLSDLVERGYGAYAQAFKDAGLDVPDLAEERAAAPERAETAILAGGCYWGMEDLIRKLPGVLDTEVGFCGGHLQNPKYEDVRSGTTGHAESIQVRFDPRKLSYADLLDFYFRIHDPTTANRQGNDRGSQYRSAIFVTGEEQRLVAERVKAQWEASGKWKRPIVTEIASAGTFWSAKEDHQDYLEKYPNGYTCHFLREWDEE